RKRKAAVHHHASDLMQAISLALFHLHSRGWGHHSLKPDNILIDENFKIRIVDLSLASRTVCGIRDAVRYALLEWDIATLFGRKTEIRGTRTCIAPETLQRKKPTPQTDMYSFGIMAFEMVTGVPPFTARTPAELLNKHLRAAPPTAVSLNPNVSSEMDRVLQRLMQKKPQQRYRNMRELITEFSRIKVWKRAAHA
ncbi:MAG: protein kinase, partial [Planctomycetaceae bacterium]